MSKLVKKIFEQIVSRQRYVALREAFYRYGQVRKELGPDDFAALSDRRWSESVERIRRLKDKHKGERCVIIGNGPSLKNMDLSVLKEETTFGLNRIYMLFDEWGFETTYHVVINQLVIEQCFEDINKLAMPHFVNWRSRDDVEFTSSCILIKGRYEGLFGFAKRLDEGFWEGMTVTYAAIQVAYYMGFSDVVLVGVDHNFTTKGDPHKEIVSEGGDADHFDTQYFGKGFRWNLPDLEGSEMAYRLAKLVFDRAGRRIVDATLGGKLDVFPKVELKSYLSNS